MPAGCGRNLREIDAEVERLLAETSSTLGREATPPAYAPVTGRPAPTGLAGDYADESLATHNPASSELTFQEADNDIRRVLSRLSDYSRDDGTPISMDLSGALRYAFKHSRDYMFAEEDYVIDVLNLLRERHLWGPRFFDEVTADITGEGDDGVFDTALRLVNEYRVTQRLPYGGEVSARALARVTEDLHERVVGEPSQSVDVILDARIPLMRGAGIAARENRIQAERNVAYGARRFERFRRDFVFDISSDFLNLVVLKQGISNAEDQVRSLLNLTEEQRSRQNEGLTDVINSGLAEQRYLQALDSLNAQQERYRLAVERFKVRLGMDINQPLTIVESTLGLPVPKVALDDAVRMAMSSRLDLQTRRDQLNDAIREIRIAENGLRPDFDIIGSLSVPTDPDRARAGVDFSPNNGEFSAGIRFGVPLDREIDRVDVRRAQIDYERAVRAFDEFVDTLAVSVRSAVRDIDRAKFSLAIQAKGIKNATERLEATELDETATARDRSEAADDLNRAKNDFDSAFRDLQLSVLRYLLETGQLRVGTQGLFLPLDGMTIDPLEESARDRILEEGMDVFDLIDALGGSSADGPAESTNPANPNPSEGNPADNGS
jgi:outer membrane protein TolC